MGSIKFIKKSRGWQPGKINAPLEEKLKKVEWGEYRLGDLFEKLKIKKLNYKTSDLPNSPKENYTLPVLTAGIQNQGLNNYVPYKEATVLKNVITISANGANTGATFYQNKEFTVLQDAYAIDFIDKNLNISDKEYLFITSSISKSIYGNFDWSNKAGWERVKNFNIKLPTKNNQIDFSFMDEFISELESERLSELAAYLKISGFDNYELSDSEKQALKDFESLEWEEFNLEKLFGKSTRGKRLKSLDRVPGPLPFVTAGEANEGISDFIGNNVEIFNKNTITIDMFGSAKYRNYNYGGDDHIAVVHTETLEKNESIFVTSSIHKSSHNGQFNYGRNFYAKDADLLNIFLPTKYNKIDFDFMNIFISAVHKLVIKDVVKYKDKRIEATRKVIEKTRS